MKILILVISALLITSCSTTPQQEGPHTDIGVWEGRAQVTDKFGKKNWVNVTWASDSHNNRMRISLSAIMDYPVAMFLKSNQQHDLWLFDKRRHIQSESGVKLFKLLTKLSLDPEIFFSFLGKPQAPGIEWSCSESGQEFKCHSAQLKTTLTVDHSQRDKRIIRVENAGKKAQLRLSRSKVQVSDRNFKPLKLSHFKTIKI